MSSGKSGNFGEPEFRPLSDLERLAIAKLLNQDFPGRSELAQQTDGASGRTIDADGSLALAPDPAKPPAEVTRRIPVEAEFDDTDGVTVHVLLHVVEGYLSELEIYREDSAPLRRAIAPNEFRVIVL
jgi:hypothetical protein